MSLAYYTVLVEECAKLRARKKEAALSALKEGAEAIFAAYPELVSFSWEQYTPYFNDGDECIFGVEYHYPDLDFGRKKLREQDFFDDPVESSNRAAITCKVQDLLKLFEAEDYKEMFGDHCQVTVYLDRIETEIISHD